MSKLRPKRQMETYIGKQPSNNHVGHHRYATRQALKQSFLDSQGDDEDQIVARRSRYSRRYWPYGLSTSSTRMGNYQLPSWYQSSIIKMTGVKLEESIRSTIEKSPENASDTKSEKIFRSSDAAECESDISLDRVTRDEIVRKVSTCLSFYGNFVIIPAVKETLDRIEEVDKNVKFSYWHEVMTFIDSYDLPCVSNSRKKLIDELVKKITEYVENEGISAHDWQTILCTLPDDVSSKFDHRLEGATMDEVTTLAKQHRLPFNLSGPTLQILQSAKKNAGKYIRHNKN